MNEIRCHPVFRAKALRKTPIKVLFEAALAVFRTSNGIAAIADPCPHRSASLSGGRVVGDMVECP